MQKTLFSKPTKVQGKPPPPKIQQVERGYDAFSEDELPIARLIERRRRQMLVHSCLYYELDINIISDAQFDNWGKELVRLQAEHPSISQRVVFYESFKNWDASTGCHLPYKDDWVMRKALQLKNYRGVG